MARCDLHKSKCTKCYHSQMYVPNYLFPLCFWFKGEVGGMSEKFGLPFSKLRCIQNLVFIGESAEGGCSQP